MPNGSRGARPAPIDLIGKTATDFDAVVLGQDRSTLVVSLPVPLADGRTIPYALSVEIEGNTASARETTCTHLPTFCPERHINLDSTFCLYWKPVEGIAIEGASNATEWWETVVRFLQYQARAARLRRWPDARGRGHGAAAYHQYAAELAAEELGPRFVEDLASGAFKVVNGTHGANGRALRLTRGNERVLSVWRDAKRVVNIRRACVCERPRPERRRAMASCPDHAKAAVELVLSLDEMRKAEERFWQAFAGQPCCGTMDECPLREPATTKGHP